MQEIPKISDLEWLIMEVIWEKGPLASSDIIASLEDDNDWSPKTIHTMISRLVKKGAIAAKKEGAFYIYCPLVDEEDCKKEATDSFIKKVYKGSLQMLVSNFIKQEGLTKEEIEDLQNILNESKKDEER